MSDWRPRWETETNFPRLNLSTQLKEPLPHILNLDYVLKMNLGVETDMLSAGACWCGVGRGAPCYGAPATCRCILLVGVKSVDEVAMARGGGGHEQN